MNLSVKKILITAGPTRENIDDVRYISNHSSGKMGFAIAEKAITYGAEVILVTGPVNLSCSEKIKRIDVISAEEMYRESINNFENCNIAILSAAVADYTPANIHTGKIKKENFGDNPVIELKKTKDILFELGKIKTDKQFLVGFALESENLKENAKEKLIRKNCDIIVANHANMPNSGFGGDNNTITLIGKNDYSEEFLPASKKECAEIILKKIAELFKKI